MHHCASSANHFFRIYFSTLSHTIWSDPKIAGDKNRRAEIGKNTGSKSETEEKNKNASRHMEFTRKAIPQI